MTATPAPPARAGHTGRARPPLCSGARIRSASDFLKLELDTRVRMFEEMTTRECAQLFHDWAFWARPEQAPPDGTGASCPFWAGPGAAKAQPAGRGGATVGETT